MLTRAKVNGFIITYAVIDPKTDNVYAAHQNGATIKEIGKREGADVAINFNYANDKIGLPIGRLIVGGKVVNGDITKTALRDEIYMLPDKSLHIGKAPAGALWAMQGSPPLLKDGKNVIAEGIERDQLGSDIWRGANYRTAGGVTASGKLVIIRTNDKLTLDDLADVMQRLGCVNALNGDGGGSSYLWPADDGWGRKLGAALIVKKGKVDPVVKPILIIDPGHGGSDPGASGNGIIEKQYTLDISLYQFERFKALGVPVALTRSTDISLDSEKRTDIVKASGAKYCISNHINAAGAEDAEGAETIHSIHSDGKIATALARAIEEAGQPFRRVFCNDNKGIDYYFMHRLTGNVTTTIVEYGFCTNAADAARIKENWKAYAEAVVRAFCSFIGHPYAAPKEEEPVTGTGTFIDVPDNHPMRGSIEKAEKAGVIGGIGGGKFGLGQPVTREQLAVILDRIGILDEIIKRLEGGE